MLEDRLQNYKDAFDAAKSAGDTSKQRRADRGLKVSVETCSIDLNVYKDISYNILKREIKKYKNVLYKY